MKEEEAPCSSMAYLQLPTKKKKKKSLGKVGEDDKNLDKFKKRGYFHIC